MDQVWVQLLLRLINFGKDFALLFVDLLTDISDIVRQENERNNAPRTGQFFNTDEPIVIPDDTPTQALVRAEDSDGETLATETEDEDARLDRRCTNGWHYHKHACHCRNCGLRRSDCRHSRGHRLRHCTHFAASR